MHFVIISYLLSLLSSTSMDKFDAIWWIWRGVRNPGWYLHMNLLSWNKLKHVWQWKFALQAVPCLYNRAVFEMRQNKQIFHDTLVEIEMMSVFGLVWVIWCQHWWEIALFFVFSYYKLMTVVFTQSRQTHFKCDLSFRDSTLHREWIVNTLHYLLEFRRRYTLIWNAA